MISNVMSDFGQCDDRLKGLNAGIVLTAKELADEIFGSVIPSASDRPKVLVTRLRKKAIDSLNETRPIKTVHQ